MHTWSPDFAMLSLTRALRSLLADDWGGGFVLQADDDEDDLSLQQASLREAWSC